MSRTDRLILLAAGAYVVLLLAACSYVIGGKNPFVVEPLRPCAGADTTATRDSVTVCADTTGQRP